MPANEGHGGNWYLRGASRGSDQRYLDFGTAWRAKVRPKEEAARELGYCLESCRRCGYEQVVARNYLDRHTGKVYWLAGAVRTVSSCPWCP